MGPLERLRSQLEDAGARQHAVDRTLDVTTGACVYGAALDVATGPSAAAVVLALAAAGCQLARPVKPSEQPEHATRVYPRGHGWRAACSCGWDAGEWGRATDAREAAAGHRVEALERAGHAAT